MRRKGQVALICLVSLWWLVWPKVSDCKHLQQTAERSTWLSMAVLGVLSSVSDWLVCTINCNVRLCDGPRGLVSVHFHRNWLSLRSSGQLCDSFAQFAQPGWPMGETCEIRGELSGQSWVSIMTGKLLNSLSGSREGNLSTRKKPQAIWLPYPADEDVNTGRRLV